MLRYFDIFSFTPEICFDEHTETVDDDCVPFLYEPTNTVYATNRIIVASCPVAKIITRPESMVVLDNDQKKASQLKGALDAARQAQGLTIKVGDLASIQFKAICPACKGTGKPWKGDCPACGGIPTIRMALIDIDGRLFNLAVIHDIVSNFSDEATFTVGGLTSAAYVKDGDCEAGVMPVQRTNDNWPSFNYNDPTIQNPLLLSSS
jgi:hypothetical protein